MNSATRVLFIGIDAGDGNLIRKWAGDGYLPHLETLFRTSAWSVTDNPPGLYVGAVWPSFYTGMSPATHARYCYRQLNAGSYDIVPISARDIKGEPFWQALDRNGKRVAVIDVPKTRIGELTHGMQIVDWGSHDPDPAGFSTWPPELAGGIEQQFGRDAMHNCNGFRTGGEEFIRFRDDLIERVRAKTRLSAHHLAQGNWDCFMTVFSETHCVGHQCWHLHDPQHPNFDASVKDIVGDPLLSVYQEIDQGIGELLRIAGGQTQVMVLASHGMGPHYDASFLLEDMLRALEDTPPPRRRAALAPLARKLWKCLPASLQRKGRGLSRNARLALDTGKAADLSRRRYFMVPNNDAYGAIRINLSGREPAGRVTPGKDYERLCASLSEDLMAFTNVETGQTLIKRILRSADLYQGENLHQLPDLLLEWNRSAPVNRIHSPKTGALEGVYKKSRTGDHTAEGLCFLGGPNVVPGQLDRRLSVMDLAPTLAALTGVQLENVDGASRAALFTAA